MELGMMVLVLGRMGLELGKMELVLGRMVLAPGRMVLALGRMALAPGRMALARGRMARVLGRKVLELEHNSHHHRDKKMGLGKKGLVLGRMVLDMMGLVQGRMVHNNLFHLHRGHHMFLPKSLFHCKDEEQCSEVKLEVYPSE